ncbi:zinc uptake protein ZrgA [Vibrio comitans]
MIKAVKPLFALSAVTIAVASASVHAEEHFRQHGAHVHGSVEFNIAQDGQDLLVEILAPGADVVGFEHAPSNDEQSQALEKAVAQLNAADSILKMSPAAGCELSTAQVSHTLSGDDDHDHSDHEDHDHEKHHDDHADHHDGHDHDSHDHDKHADEHEHHDHDAHDHSEHDHSGGHGEFNIAYQYQCKDVSKLAEIDSDWFKLFSGTQTIRVNLLTDSAQIATELTKGNTVIKL